MHGLQQCVHIVGMCQSSIHMDDWTPADHRPKRNTDSSALPSFQSASWCHEFHFDCKRKCNLSDQATFFHCSTGAFAGGQGSAWALCMVHSSAAPWGKLRCTASLSASVYLFLYFFATEMINLCFPENC